MEIKFDTKTIVALIVEAIVFIGIIICVSTCQNRKLDQANANIDALRDSIECVELKNGELMYEKQSYILEKKQLEEYIGVAKNEVKEIENKLKSSLAYIAKIEGNVHKETIVIRDTITVEDSTQYKYSINYDYDKWLAFKMNGEFNIQNGWMTTNVYDINVPIPLTVGLTNDYKIFVKTENPYVSFTDIQGAVVDASKVNQKPKRWNVGLQLGIGTQYGLIGKQFDVGPYLGIGIAYGFGF